MDKETVDYPLKKIPRDLYERIQKQAKLNNRSVNAEIKTILDKHVEV